MSDTERYEIKGKLGEGGRGSVYEAYDRQLKRKVALKRLHPGEDIDAGEAYETVLKESHALSALNSSHIVRVYDVGQDEEGPYVVMELLDGKTLQEIVARAPLVEGDFFQVAEQALEGLVAAHSEHLLHRDLKPENLMLTWLPSGRIMLKLLDFGLAKFATAPVEQVPGHDLSLVGSIYFMAPEQFDRQPVTEQTDLYSLGCVFYFALAGSYPFAGDHVTQVLASHLSGTCIDLKTERPDLFPELCDWIMKFMAREPADRPGSAQEALDELGAIRKRAVTPTSALKKQTGLVTATAAGAAPVGRVLSAGGRSPAGRTVPASIEAIGGMPKWFFPTVGVLVLLIVGAGAALFHRLNSDGDDPAAASPEDPPAEVVAGEGGGTRKTGDPKATKSPGTAAVADPAPPKPVPPRKLDMAQRLFDQRDKNKDGELSFNEYLPTFDKKIRNAERKTFDSFDTDRNNALTIQEMRRKGAGMAEFLGRDKNGDVQLTLEEWLSFRPGNTKQAQAKEFERKDTDKDRNLTLEEYRAGAPPKAKPGNKPGKK